MFKNKGIQTLLELIANCVGVELLVQDINKVVIARSGVETAEKLSAPDSVLNYNGKDLGYVYVLSDKKQWLGHNNLIFDFIVDIVSLELYRQTQYLDHGAQARIDFINELLAGENIQEETVIIRSKHLGINFNQNIVVIVADIDNFVKFAMNHTEEYLSQIKDRIYLTINMVIKSKIALVQRADKLIILIPMENQNNIDNENKCLELALEIRKELLEKMPEVTTTIGIGNICRNLLGINKSYMEAMEAISIGRVAFGRDRIIRYNDLGVFLLLPSMRDNPTASNLFNLWLGKIVDYDRIKGTFLLQTLETYLETNCDINETTSKLYIHRNTLRYRLDKIAELTNSRFPISANKFQYLLLIKIWRLSK